jgi:hypothetical protein
VSDRPEQLRRLDTLQGAADLAHQAIFDMHRELLGRDRAQAESTRLLAESARIATARLPQLTAQARRLGAKWDEEWVLDPPAVAGTARKIVAELAVVEPEISSLLARQREIAARLRELLAP